MVTYYTYEDMKELDRAMWEIGISRAIADHESSGDDLMVQENGEYLDLDGNQSSIQKIEVRVHEQGCPVRRCEMRYDTEKKIMSFDSFNEKGERLDNYSPEAQTDDHWSAEKNFFSKAEGIKKARENAAEQNGGKRVEEPPFYYTYDEMEALLYRAMGEMGIPFGDYDSLFEGNELMIGEDGEYQDLDGNQSDRQELSIDLDEEDVQSGSAK